MGFFFNDDLSDNMASNLNNINHDTKHIRLTLDQLSNHLTINSVGAYNPSVFDACIKSCYDEAHSAKNKVIKLEIELKKVRVQQEATNKLLAKLANQLDDKKPKPNYDDMIKDAWETGYYDGRGENRHNRNQLAKSYIDGLVKRYVDKEEY